ncbi:S-adenosyl-L-methionine-dependent methyltransferase [Brazilian cedratvirus IHUMI]|uniref:S-adenosyl-L-methionine-dependent methyltransferase n=1 Tax=Brazilian cedratvirus IHUMI TaxID=2126980 RepID=A0A2R8FEB9_9VIRU|nr:S-adenosyl-L-methionine-dependent methyltransferase [Brazilian cedratvirus IHUMI]
MLLLTLFSIFLYLKSLVERFLFPSKMRNPFVRDLPTDVLSYNLCKREKPSRRFFPNFKKPKTTFFALNVFPGLFSPSTETLSQAQKSMMRKIGRNLSLTPGTRILDIGCSSPALISYLSQTYDVYIDGLTSSPSRYEMCCSLDLKGCNFYLSDFGEFTSPLPYHRIYSSTPFIYQDDTFLQKIRSHLLDDGYFLCFLLQGESLHSWLNMELGLMDKELVLDRQDLLLSRLDDLTLHYDKTLLLKSFLCENKLGNYTLGVLSGCLRARRMRLYQCLFKREQV